MPDVKTSKRAGSYTRAVAVGGGNDYTTYTPPLDALYVGTAGNVRVLTESGEDVVLGNVAGWIWLRVKKVFATNTAASNISGYR